MCYPVCGMVHIKERLLLICVVNYHSMMPYNHKYNVLSVSLNKTFPSCFHQKFEFNRLISGIKTKLLTGPDVAVAVAVIRQWAGR